MLCRSIAVKGLNKIQELLKGAEMAEIRVEKSGLDIIEVEKIFASHPNLIATCRDEGLLQYERVELLIAAIDGGAKWIDIEVESDENYASTLVEYAKSKGCKVIISYHNYENTPKQKELNDIIKECAKMGADLVKIATMVNKTDDAVRLLELYNSDISILALGMGELGKNTRVSALKLGAPFTFVSCDGEQETAPGQISESKMKSILGL